MIKLSLSKYPFLLNISILLILTNLSGCVPQGNDLVTTGLGKILGNNNGTVRTFRGVRFANPPVGELRWAPPQALSKWNGTQEALVNGAGCVQGGIPTDVFSGDEDCLFLNIWVPSKPGTYPVMVWFHGGGLLQGSGSGAQYSGKQLAGNNDVIVVNVNSRLSFLGFVATPQLTEESEYGGSGNQGFLDQVEALRWVQQEISNFGGDPNNVTIFGESGGAISVCSLLASPLSDDLFQKAIMQSGSCRMVRTPSLAGGEAKGDALFAKLGCDTASNPLACARALPAADIVKAVDIKVNELFVEHPDDWAYYPTSNIDSYFLPEHPITLLKKGVKPEVSVLLGTNKDEGTMFVGLRDHSDNEAGYLNYLSTFYGDMAPQFSQLYPFADYSSAGHAAAALAGDGFMDCPSREMGDIMSQTGHSVFMYQFIQDVSSFTTDIILELQRGENTPPWGTYHTAEIPYVFGIQSVLGYVNNPERLNTQDIMMRYWTNFAHTGNPNDVDLPLWPAYSATQTDYIHLGGDFGTATNLKPTQCDFWINHFFANGNW